MKGFVSLDREKLGELVRVKATGPETSKLLRRMSVCSNSGEARRVLDGFLQRSKKVGDRCRS